MTRTEEDLRTALSACEDAAPDPVAVRRKAERTVSRYRRGRAAGLVTAAVLAVGSATAVPALWQGGERPATPAVGGPEVSARDPLPRGAVARLWIPRLDRHWAVVEGVAHEDIRDALGHYPRSAMPGQVGNVAVAGRCTAAQFGDAELLRPGDSIFLEDTGNWYEYQVTESRTGEPGEVDVVAPVPGKPDAEPTERLLTLTTCHVEWDDSERLVVHATLVGAPTPKSEGRPPELAD